MEGVFRFLMEFLFGGSFMNILICDDDKAYVEDIKKHVSSYMQDRRIEAKFDVSFTGRDINFDKFYDIAFLDVEMGKVKGTELAEYLKLANRNIVIFIITAYNKYLDEAMDLNVLRFIIKPLDVERLRSGLSKAVELIDKSVLNVFLKDDKGLVRVPVNDIVYIEIVDRSTKVVTRDNTYVSTQPMKYWRAHLKTTFFYSIHTSFIVNMKYITRYSREVLEMNNAHIVPVAYRKQTEFRNYFVNYFSGM